MSESINLQKQVYDKRQYTKVIDTSFKELGVQTIQERIAAQPTTEEFFALYNELFYNIPELGATNSHEYLIKTSSEYINFDANQEEITALQAEIAQLRTDLLDAQRQIVELQTGTTLANPQ
jgi:cell division protein FtsL